MGEITLSIDVQVMESQKRPGKVHVSDYEKKAVDVISRFGSIRVIYEHFNSIRFSGKAKKCVNDEIVIWSSTQPGIKLNLKDCKL